MRPLLAAACVCGMAIAPGAQERPLPVLRNPTDFAAAMIRIGDDWAIVSEAVEGPTYLLNSVRGDGLTRLDRMTRELESVGAFLQTHAKTDASSFAVRARLAVEELRIELARAEPDQAAAIEGAQSVAAQCAACHERFRDGDPAAGYRFKPGVID